MACWRLPSGLPCRKLCQLILRPFQEEHFLDLIADAHPLFDLIADDGPSSQKDWDQGGGTSADGFLV